MGFSDLDVAYVDLNSPEIFEYPDEFGEIAQNNMALPYISLDGKKISAGEVLAKNILSKITGLIQTV